MDKQFKIRVLHIVTATSWRGGEQQVAYLLEELKNEVENIVLCSEGGKMATYCQNNGHKFFTQKKGGGIDLAYSKRINQICKSEKIDLCHLHDAHAHTYAILAADLFRNECPLILSRRVDFPVKDNLFSKYKYNHRLIKRILCVSEAIKEITKRGIKNPERLITVYSGIDLQKFSPANGKLRQELGINATTFLVGSTSALADHKDYFTFIDSVEIVHHKDPTIQFVVLGTGPMEKEIKDYAKSKNLESCIRFLGFRSDVHKLIADFDLFLITSKTEGLGTSILDAFATKVPVVATAAGGIPELVESNETGLLFPVGDTSAIADGILSLSKDKLKANQLAESAFKKVAQFSKNATAKNTLNVYEGLINEILVPQNKL